MAIRIWRRSVWAPLLGTVVACSSGRMPVQSTATIAEPVQALASFEDGSWLIGFASSLSRVGAHGDPLARFEFGPEAKATLDGLATDGRVVWGSGWVEGPLVTPAGSLAPRGATDAFVAQWDADTLRLRWAKRFGTGGVTMGRRVALAKDGSAWVVGMVEQQLGVALDGPKGDGTADGFALRLDATGAALQLVRFASAGQDMARGVAIAEDGTVAVVGQYGGPTEAHPSGAPDGSHDLVVGERRLAHKGDADGFVLLLDRNGEAKAATAIAELGFDVVKDVLPTPEGWVVVGSVKLDGGEAGHIVGSGPLQGFVAWLDTEGRLLREDRPDGLVSAHALARGPSGWWAAGHASAAGGARDAPRDMVLMRVTLQGSSEVARCSSVDGRATGYAVTARHGVLFAGIARPPMSCVHAEPAFRGFTIARLLGP